MKLRLLTLGLLASTALPGMVLAQTATPGAEATKPATKQTQQTQRARRAAPAAQAAPAAVAAAPTRDARAQAGMTASPADFGRVDIKEGAGATPGGVTGKDLGGGYMIEEEALKTRSTVTRDAIDKLSPTANPYQMIQMLPGANVSSVDAFGLVGGNITMRGFNSDQIGLTIEGAPVNDSGNYALYPQEYVDSENISQASIAQGYSDLDSPHIGATGGVMNIYMREPAKKYGGMVGFSLGTQNTTREFVRIETGQIGDFRAFASYSHYQGKHWNDPGKNSRNHIDFKGVYEPGQGNRIALSVIYNEATNNSYLAPTLAQYASNTTWLSSLPSTFFAPTNATTPDRTAGGASNWYGFKVNPFKNAIVSLPSNFAINSNLTFDVVPYYWYGFGNGGGTATMTEGPTSSTSGGMFFGNARITGQDFDKSGIVSSGGKTLYYNPSITETNRPGIVNKLTYTLGDHKLIGGYWLEVASHHQTAPYAALAADGTIIDPYLTSGAYVIGSGSANNAGAVMQRRDQLTRTTTNMVFVGDTWSINNRWTMEMGVKQAFIKRHVTNTLPGATPVVDYSDQATLPQLGLRYKLDDKNQIFTSLGTSFRSTPNYTLADSFSNSTGVKTPWQAAPTEKSITAELGHRYQGETFVTSVSLFGTRYSNRQISTTVIDPTNPLGTTTTSLTINAGSANVYGLDGEIGTRRLFGGWRAYASGELLSTRILDNLPINTSATVKDYLPTSGKSLPRSPGQIVAFTIDYDDDHLFGNLTYKWIGSQYSTMVNDEKIPGFGRVDGAIGYRFDKIGFANQPEFKINLYNILNAKSLTGVYGIQNNALLTKGVNGNNIAAASNAPTYYAGQGFAAIASFKVGF